MGHFISNLANVNEESMIKFSPSKSKRNSLSHKLNISNIVIRPGQDTLIDEEDHAILSRLI